MFCYPLVFRFVAIWDHTVLKHSYLLLVSDVSFVAIWDHTVLKLGRENAVTYDSFVAIWDHTVLKPTIAYEY